MKNIISNDHPPTDDAHRVKPGHIPGVFPNERTNDSMSNDFTVPNISIAGAPTIDWTFTGAVARAEIAGAKAYAEAIDDHTADLRITDATGEVLADILVRRMPADESITISLMNVGTALLWSHVRWLEANKAGHVNESAPMSEVDAGAHGGKYVER